MTAALALHTFRECTRRAFPFVALFVLLGLVLVSRLFFGFTFGADAQAARSLVLGAGFLAAVVHAALVGTGLIRRDIERGTLAMLLARPMGLPRYLAGRFLGVFAAGAALAAAVCAGAVALLLLLPAEGALDLRLFTALPRLLAPLAVLEAAALALAATLPRAAAPAALVALLFAGDLAGSNPVGILFVDFGLFGLETGLGVAPASALYCLMYCLAYLIAAHVALSVRSSLRSGD